MSAEIGQIDERHRAEHPGMWLRLPCCESSVHPVRIKYQSDGQMIVTAPTEPHSEWIKQPEPTDIISLGWTDVGGTLILRCSVPQDGVEDGTWKLTVLSTQDFMQRREYVRVSSDATIHLMGREGKVVEGKVLDISEAGMRCEFEDFIPVISELPYQFALHLGEMTLAVTCTLRWTGRSGPVQTEAGFEFVNAYDSLLTRLRSYVMAQLDTRGPYED